MFLLLSWRRRISLERSKDWQCYFFEGLVVEVWEYFSAFFCALMCTATMYWRTSQKKMSAICFFKIKARKK